MIIRAGKAVGLNTDQEAALALTFESEGKFFLGVVRILGDDAFAKGRQLLSDSHDLFQSLEGSVGDRLTKTFSQAKKAADIESLDLLLAAISGKGLFLYLSGEMEVFLKREEKLSILTSESSQNQL